MLCARTISLVAVVYRWCSDAHRLLSKFYSSLLHVCRGCSIQAVPDSAPPHPIVSSAPTVSPSLPLAATSAQMNLKKGPADSLASRVEDLGASSLVVGLVCVQALTLVGSLVGGHLARKRRKEVERVNQKLRKVPSVQPSLHLN